MKQNDFFSIRGRPQDAWTPTWLKARAHVHVSLSWLFTYLEFRLGIYSIIQCIGLHSSSTQHYSAFSLCTSHTGNWQLDSILFPLPSNPGSGTSFNCIDSLLCFVLFIFSQCSYFIWSYMQFSQFLSPVCCQSVIYIQFCILGSVTL